MKCKLSIALLAVGAILLSSCKDEFADINTDPSTITKGNVQFLFTQGLHDFEPSDYTYWFYSAKQTSQWSQAFTPFVGFKSNFNFQGDAGNQGSQTYRVMKVYREVEKVLSDMKPSEAEKYVSIKSMFYPLMVYLGMFDTDMYGDMPYTEACMAKYSNPMILTPKYDNVESLYDIWLSELNKALDGFKANNQINLGKQDFVYGGDVKKWAKFTNSLKLKIAVRLLNVNKQKAIQIVEEAVNNPAGLLDGLADDFVYNRATQGGDDAFHFGNNVSSGAGAKPVVDLLVKNRDPRVRFFYNKNDFNSRVVQGFFDAGKPLPAYIESNVEYTTDANGKKKFVAWKGAGEPWVRYYGLPTDFNAGSNPLYFDYFDSNSLTITLNGKEKTYTPYASFQEELVRGGVDYIYPDVPGATVSQDKEDIPWFGLFFSTAEVNLYLAEFKLLGAKLPQSADYYYNNGVKMSVLAYDNLAKLNKIPYYLSKFDENEETIGLKNGEIDAMMAKADYTLSGSSLEMLEKVYIQLYLHFMYQPNDQFVTVRRSGVPMRGSSILPWVDIIPQSSTLIPRRFDVSAPNNSDLMYGIKMAAYKSQGFSLSNKENPKALNAERLWQDKGAPNFGEGPAALLKN